VLLAASVLLAAAVGPVLGTTLILTSGAPLPLANAVAGLTFALLMPYVGVVMTYLFSDLRIRASRPRPTEDVLPAEA